MRIVLSRYESPIGPLVLASEGDALLALEFPERSQEIRPRLEQAHPGAEVKEGALPRPFASALAAYFGGDTRALDRVQVRTEGTPFQREVWAALRRIPAGQTWSYQELARAVGRPRASRAVGAANGANPVALVVPCHRVIATGGKLGGYGGGLHRKEWLLKHERALIA
ncbi:MAG TPA: methylated-DNA--[protein]-cysteine S-methyltransferase [Myxococcales bacterium]|nr:methylated-DNA--[protein]-cysteine S-methyltransferase [Myxococcales bacterium]